MAFLCSSVMRALPGLVFGVMSSSLLCSSLIGLVIFVTCDSCVNALLSVVKAFGYPKVFANNWKGNDPCDNWQGVVCAANGNISVVNFQKMGLSGTISPNFTLLPSIQKLILSGNSLTGTIPSELMIMPNLVELDVSNNWLYGAVPAFRNGVKVNTDGNPDIGKARSSSPSPAPPGSPSSGGDGGSESGKTKSKVGVIVGASVGGVVVLLSAGAAVYCWLSKKRKSVLVKYKVLMQW